MAIYKFDEIPTYTKEEFQKRFYGGSVNPSTTNGGAITFNGTIPKTDKETIWDWLMRNWKLAIVGFVALFLLIRN